MGSTSPDLKTDKGLTDALQLHPIVLIQEETEASNRFHSQNKIRKVSRHLIPLISSHIGYNTTRSREETGTMLSVHQISNRESVSGSGQVVCDRSEGPDQVVTSPAHAEGSACA